MEIVEIKCSGCGMMRKWRGYECLTFCDCLADKAEDESNLLDAQVIKKNADGGKVDCMNCYECLKDKKDERTGLSIAFSRMILCPTCGNKRCPKATDHNLDCTHSNESGQPRSRY